MSSYVASDGLTGTLDEVAIFDEGNGKHQRVISAVAEWVVEASAKELYVHHERNTVALAWEKVRRARVRRAPVSSSQRAPYVTLNAEASIYDLTLEQEVQEPR